MTLRHRSTGRCVVAAAVAPGWPAAPFAVMAIAALVGVTAPALAQSAAWLDSSWPFRRAIDVQWAPEKGTGDEIAVAQFYTAGHAKPNGEDVRVASEDGRVVPSRLLMMGPGDLCSVAFQLVKPHKRYFVFFGNTNPPPPPKGTEDVNYRCAVFVESRVPAGGGPLDNFARLEQAWERSHEVIGRAFIGTLYLGMNLFDDRVQYLSKYRGTLRAPMDGTYTFAISAQNRGGLWIDGKPVVFAHGLVGDARFSAKIELTKGPHEAVVIQACEQDGRLSVGWFYPGARKLDVILGEAFGLAPLAVVGGLDELKKPFTADFKVEHMGECFYENHYSYRYRFTANGAAKGQSAKVEWDFGDGQHASGAVVEHVFLEDGVYPVKLSETSGTNQDAQACRVAARRDRERLVRPPTDLPDAQAKIVATYDAKALPPTLLPWAAVLCARADLPDPALAAARELAHQKGGIDPNVEMLALEQATRAAIAAGKTEAALALWDAVPAEALIKQRAVIEQAGLLLWQVADLPRGLMILAPYAKSNDPQLKQIYGQALVLNQRAAEGRKVLSELTTGTGTFERQVAISGAMARTVDFFVTERDAESGEAEWQRWQSRYPIDFLEGYSALLRVKLMELKKNPEAAARVAEAFAKAVPQSSYSPQLLDRASRIMTPIDPAKGKALRDLLKANYPEDPLAQDPPAAISK